MQKKRINRQGLIILIVSIDILLLLFAFFANGGHIADFEMMQVHFIAISLVNKALLVKWVLMVYEEMYTDMLTGLYTRRYFYRRMRRADRRTPLSLLFFDIDNFKAINDKYGHMVGDRILAQFGSILQSYKNRNSAIFRWGGEEFVMVLFFANGDEAYTIADSIRKAVEEHTFSHRGSMIRITISIGIASADKRAAVDVEQMLEAADRALYRAKVKRNNIMNYK